MVALPCVIETMLLAADIGLLGDPSWRVLAYQNGAFWQELLGNWQPKYAAQPATMFITYALLHADPVHLAGNMLVLVLLGRRVIRSLGTGFFLLLYVGSAIGGGLGFALLSSTPQPMVGASGALFGLAGALLCLEVRPGMRLRLAYGPVGAAIIGLVILNLLLWNIKDGLLAWQAHMSGFLAGWALTAFFRRRGKPDLPTG